MYPTPEVLVIIIKQKATQAMPWGNGLVLLIPPSPQKCSAMYYNSFIHHTKCLAKTPILHLYSTKRKPPIRIPSPSTTTRWRLPPWTPLSTLPLPLVLVLVLILIRRRSHPTKLNPHLWIPHRRHNRWARHWRHRYTLWDGCWDRIVAIGGMRR
jgi:hypothetical protein